jgi:hypothetical protein
MKLIKLIGIVLVFGLMLMNINVQAQQSNNKPMTAQEPALKNPFYVGGANKSEETAFNELLKEGYETLRSDLFRSNIKSLAIQYPTVFLRIEGVGTTGSVKTGTVNDVVDIIQSKAPYRYVEVPVSLYNTTSTFFNLAGVIGDNINASWALGRANFYTNWLSTDMVMKSCGINNVAHEMSHLISSDATVFSEQTQPIKDRGAATRSGTDPVASYLVGTVAQCTWLQQKNYSPTVDLKACVQVFGHRGFNGLRCNQFNQIREIKYRSGLPPEHIIND